MIRDPLVFAGISDLAGKLRGRAFPARKLEKRLAGGVGWVPTNALITCFDTISPSPFGSLGDLVLKPDPDTMVEIDFEDGTAPEHLVLADVLTLDGAPWSCCTRSMLAAALERLEKSAGLKLNAAFEHEFQLIENGAPLALPGGSFSFEDFDTQKAVGEALMAALGMAGMAADTFLREYGPGQYEVTVEPTTGIAAADSAVLLRALTQATLRRFGRRATFSPILDPAGVGNGVHVHLSFTDAAGAPATYDPDGPLGMAGRTGAFIAGILRHLPSTICLAAASAISYARLTPHRWSAAFNNLGYRDREAALRICPVTASDPDDIARQYNFEFRAADATASPYLVLAGIVHAGCQGIEDGLAPPPSADIDLSTLSHEELSRRGYVRLPQSLEAALTAFERDETVRGWFPGEFAEVYLSHKRGELQHVNRMDEADRYAAYARAY